MHCLACSSRACCFACCGASFHVLFTCGGPLPAHAVVQAAVARAILEYAGLPVGDGPDAPVQVVTGLSGGVLPRLRQLAGLGAGAAAGLVFLDHCKQVGAVREAAPALLLPPRNPVLGSQVSSMHPAAPSRACNDGVLHNLAAGLLKVAHPP